MKKKYKINLEMIEEEAEAYKKCHEGYAVDADIMERIEKRIIRQLRIPPQRR